MAHFIVFMVQGLSFYTDGREPGRTVKKLHECYGYIFVQWFMAWRWVELCSVGGIHGAAQIYEKAFEIKKSDGNDLFSWIRRFVVFAFVSFAWIFFRADNIHEGFYAMTHILNGMSHLGSYILNGFATLGLDDTSKVYLFIYLIPLVLVDFLSLKNDVFEWIGRQKVCIRHCIMILLLVSLLLYGYAGQSTFVYFQF